jgi:hypothetical protein
MSDTPIAANERENSFFEEVCATKLIYALNNGNGWFNWKVGSDHCFPVWPDETSANDCALVENPTYKPKSIELSEFLSSFLPALAEQEVWISLNPLPDMRGNERPASIVAQLLKKQAV